MKHDIAAIDLIAAKVAKAAYCRRGRHSLGICKLHKAIHCVITSFPAKEKEVESA